MQFFLLYNISSFYFHQGNTLGAKTFFQEDIGPSKKAQDTETILEMNRTTKDQKLKNHLLGKYRGHLSSLRQEVTKKGKAEKLPKEARLKLLSWWESHYKWPYPSVNNLSIYIYIYIYMGPSHVLSLILYYVHSKIIYR